MTGDPVPSPPSGAKPTVEIAYCRQCGHLLRAGWMAQEILRAFEEELDAVVLRPAGGGAFLVSLDGEVLFSRREAGRFPEPREIKQRIGERIGSPRRFGHEPAAPQGPA